MKKEHLFLGSIIVFLLLFYKQSLGVNLFVFNLVLVASVYIFKPEVRKDNNVLILSLGALITAGAVAWYADLSSIILNILSLLVLPIFIHKRQKSIIFSETASFWNILTTPIRLIRDRKVEKDGLKQNLLMKRILLYIVLPFIVFVLFFYLYRHVNPVWGDYMWEMIGYVFSWTFIWVLLLAVLLMYAFWYTGKSPRFVENVANRSNNLMPTDKPTFKSIPLDMEMWSGVLLFTLLNLLLFSLLAADFQQLFIANEIPKGYSLSEYLHKGVYAVILSIVFAITLLIFYFKGAFNYHKKGKILRVLAWIWIVFNVILVVFTFYKNILYVEAYALTFKRVSVFIYLLLCLVGLYFVSVKLYLKKSFVYLMNKMYWAFYIMWVLTTPMNWTNWITSYNLEHAKEKNYEGEGVDIDYLVSEYQLDELNVKALYEFLEQNPDNPYAEQLKKGIDTKYLKIVQSDRKRKFREIRGYDKYIKNYLKQKEYKPYYARIRNEVFYEELVDVQDLQYQFTYPRNKKEADSTLLVLLKYKNVKKLTLEGSNQYLKSLADFEPMKKLTSLNLQGVDLSSNFKLQGLTQLEKFIYGNDEMDFLSFYPNLKDVEIAAPSMKYAIGWENLPALERLNFNVYNIGGLDISLLTTLKELTLNSNKMRTLKLPDELPQIEFLNIEQGVVFSDMLELPKMPKLKILQMSNNGLKSLEGIANFKNLEELVISNNEISSLKDLESLTQLKFLYLDKNKVKDITPLKNLSNLEELTLTNNPIVDYNVLYELKKLQSLRIDEGALDSIDTERLPKGVLPTRKNSADDEVEPVETVMIEDASGY